MSAPPSSSSPTASAAKLLAQRMFNKLDLKPVGALRAFARTVCGPVERKVSKCGACGSVGYCGVEHQRQDWTAGHKRRCAAVKLWRALETDLGCDDEPFWARNFSSDGLAAVPITMVSPAHLKRCTQWMFAWKLAHHSAQEDATKHARTFMRLLTLLPFEKPDEFTMTVMWRLAEFLRPQVKEFVGVDKRDARHPVVPQLIEAFANTLEKADLSRFKTDPRYGVIITFQVEHARHSGMGRSDEAQVMIQRAISVLTSFGDPTSLSEVHSQWAGFLEIMIIALSLQGGRAQEETDANHTCCVHYHLAHMLAVAARDDRAARPLIEAAFAMERAAKRNPGRREDAIGLWKENVHAPGCSEKERKKALKDLKACVKGRK